MNEATRPVGVTRPNEKRHLLAGGVQGEGWGRRQKLPEHQHPSDLGPPDLLRDSSAIAKTGPNREDSAAECVLRRVVFPCEQFAECSPVTKRS